ncbi:Crp/Fnr family transcriptional regulator [Nocardia sp. NRRL S-836]|uniref:Crp/Fnr family transcriptional regulator n=1 Tax=Nocardia sp. NRRL S-836 TaxID=1519492 RepID=UPI0018D017E3|nr:Crp/Fnr family transcriptional regulator [Nocardia sp. NRRL S-836]
MADPSAERGREALRAAGALRPFPAGRHLINAGEHSDEVLLLESGLVKVVLPTVREREPITGLFGRGDLLGELGVTGAAPRSAHVIALVAGSAWHVAGSRFVVLRAANPDVQRLVDHTWRERQRAADELQLSLVSPVPARVAACLLRWARTFGEDTGGGLELRGVSQDELSQAVAASVKSVQEVLRALRAEGLLHTGRLRFRLPDPDGMCQFIANADRRN